MARHDHVPPRRPRRRASGLPPGADEWFERTGDTYFQVQNLVQRSGALRARRAAGRTRRRRGCARRFRSRSRSAAGSWWRRTAISSRRSSRRTGSTTRASWSPSLRATCPRRTPTRARRCCWRRRSSPRRGRADAAATAFAEALRLIEALDMPLELADARMALGLSLRAFGDVSGARAELERARAMFVRIGATTRRDAIDRELADLTAHTAQDGTSSS